ncbi:MAG: replication-relaxation family protein [Phycisphaerae bacterium]
MRSKMAFQFNESDQELLVSIAEHRVLTVRHLAMLLRRNSNALRRRLKILSAQGLIEVAGRPFGRNRGRPESLVSLRGAGVELLKTSKLIDSSLPADRVTAQNIHFLDHELLVNDFRVHLTEMEQIVPALSIQFFSANSPLLVRGSDDRPLVHEKMDSDDGSYDGTGFVPDGVIGVTHTELDRTLLFFLEADRGTEPRNSPRHSNRGIRKKILNYQRYFAVEQYKRYEKILKCKLRGFRLLILTEDRARFAALCRLVRAMPPSGFVWLAGRESLLSQGLWSRIWVRGGKVNEPLQSILGSKAPNPRPTPPRRPNADGQATGAVSTVVSPPAGCAPGKTPRLIISENACANVLTSRFAVPWSRSTAAIARATRVNICRGVRRPAR